MTEITSILLGYCLGMLFVIFLDRMRDKKESAYQTYNSFNSEEFKKQCKKLMSAYNAKDQDD